MAMLCNGYFYGLRKRGAKRGQVQVQGGGYLGCNLENNVVFSRWVALSVITPGRGNLICRDIGI